jgi:hypothetical protein
MIHRDYILRMIEEFCYVLKAIATLKERQRWQQIEGTIEEQFQQLVGAGATEAVGFSETALAARLMQGEATQFVRIKMAYLIRLFKEAGDAAAARDRPEESRSLLLKGLHLLLGFLAAAQAEHPDFLPPVDVFTAALQDAPLPAATQAMLMHHHERAGSFAKAEDALFGLLDVAPATPEVLDLGIAFYERLLSQSNAALDAGNLPRRELESALAELRKRKATLPPG